MKGLRSSVLRPVVEVHWPLSVLMEYLPSPPLWMVLAQASTSALMAGVLKPLFWPGKVTSTLRTAERFGEPTPSVPVWMLHFSCRLNLVPYEPLVSPSLCVAPLPELRFPCHPQPWPLRKCAGDFELASPLPFEYPSVSAGSRSWISCRSRAQRPSVFMSRFDRWVIKWVETRTGIASK
jgi:hypothetical protein